MKGQAYTVKAGNLKNLKLTVFDLKDPNQDEVSVEVKAIGLNFADIFAIMGLYSATPKGEFIPGLEYAGVIIKVGSQVNEFKTGDKVMGVIRFGAYTTHLNIDRCYVLPLPQPWTFEEGAAYLVQLLTAFYAIKNLGDIQKGQTVLIHSAVGGVGLWAIQIAKKYQAFAIGTVGSANKVKFAKEQGYDQVIVRSNNFKSDLKQGLEGRELNLIIDCIGGKIFQTGYDLLAPMGRVVVFGSAHYAFTGDSPNYIKLLFKYIRRPKIDPQKMIEKNKGVMGFNLIWIYEKADLMHQLLSEIDQLGLEKPYVGHVYSFEELPHALRFFQTGKNIGKIIIKV